MRRCCLRRHRGALLDHNEAGGRREVHRTAFLTKQSPYLFCQRLRSFDFTDNTVVVIFVRTLWTLNVLQQFYRHKLPYNTQKCRIGCRQAPVTSRIQLLRSSTPHSSTLRGRSPSPKRTNQVLDIPLPQLLCPWGVEVLLLLTGCLFHQSTPKQWPTAMPPLCCCGALQKNTAE